MGGRTALGSAMLLLLGASAPVFADNVSALPPTAGSASHDTTPAPAGDSLDVLRARLDVLEREAALRQIELERFRAELNRRLGIAPSAGNASANAPASAPTTVARDRDAERAAITTAPAQRSVESIYQQHNVAFSPKLTVTPSITSTYSDNRFFTLNGFLALNAIFLGNVNVTQQRNDLRIAQIDATYGLTPRLQLEANAPYYIRSAKYSSVGANFAGQLPSEDTTRSSGLGDAQVGAFYALTHETGTSPGITLNGHVSLPTGRAPYGIALRSDASNTNLMFPVTLPTGSGVLGYEFGASFVKTSDPAIFFGGINYYAQTTGHFADLQFNPSGKKTPGTATPGNAIQYQLGTAFALNDKASLSFSFVSTVADATRFHPDGGRSTTVIGSSTNATVLDISAGFASNPRSTFVTDLQLGLTQDAPNFQLGFRFPTRF